MLTPDRRYLVVDGRLWRAANPALAPRVRQELTSQLMAARRAVGDAMKRRDETALKKARRAVNEAKIALGERGPVWWRDGAEDYTRHRVENTPYARWYVGAIDRLDLRRLAQETPTRRTTPGSRGRRGR